MTISVVIPVYNSKPFLEELIRQLSVQTFKDFDVIFVCDVSSDESEKVLPELLKNSSFQYTCILRPKKNGVGKARDYALDNGLIDGEFVLFLDSDDRFPADYLQRLYDSIVENNADIATCGFRRVDRRTGRVIATDMCNNPKRISVSQHESLLQLINPAPWNKLIRVSRIGDIRFGLSFMEDAVFMALLLPRCRRISFINEPIFDYFVDPNSLSGANGLKAWKVGMEGFQIAKDYAEKHIETYRGYEDCITAMAFMRVGIGATSRACMSKNVTGKKRRQILRESMQYLDTFFPDWRTNRFLSFSALIKRGFKGLLLWRCRLLYKWHMFGWFVFQYKTFTKIFKHDIKW